jgi:hypothetical protein
MHGDFSRLPVALIQNAVGPLQQQGKVLLDTHLTDATRIVSRWQDHAARAAFGAKKLAVSSQKKDSFKVAAAQVNGAAVTVMVLPGEAWADGLLVELEADAGQPDAVRLADYLAPPLEAVPANPAAPATRDAVILDVWRASLSAFQDNELLEPALGGPDTAEMLQTQMAFRLFRLDGTQTCDDIRDLIQDDFSKRGKLNVTLQPTLIGNHDCPVVQAGGYTGFEHNLYRVEIADGPPGDPVRFKWSQWNGGLVGTGEIDPSDPTHLIVLGNKTAIRTSGLSTCYLEVVSFDAQRGEWRVGFGSRATVGNNDVISLTGTVFGAAPAPGTPVFIRLWNDLRDLSEFPAATPPNELRDGIRLEFDAADATPNYLPGDYWTFPVRADGLPNPQVLVDHQPPQGVHHHRVPLGIITWGGGGQADLVDCREIFRPLTEQHGCCTLKVGMGDEGDFQKINDALAALPPEGGRICVLPGDYTENVVLENKSNVILTGCGPQTVIRSGNEQPVIGIYGGSALRIDSLTLVAGRGAGLWMQGPLTVTVNADVQPQAPLKGVLVRDLDVTASTGPGIAAFAVEDVTIRDNRVVMEDMKGDWTGIVVQGVDIAIEHNQVRVIPREGKQAVAALGGIWIQGGSARLRVRDNLISGGRGKGIVFGHVVRFDSPDPGLNLIGWHYYVDSDCGGCEDGTSFTPPGGGRDPVYRVWGQIRVVLVEGNHIEMMGLDGIGVVAFFASDRQGIVDIRDLTIAENVIINCLWRKRDPIPFEMRERMGYGGIALAQAAPLVIRDNSITRCGRDALDFICGLYVFSSYDVEVRGNRIANNGSGTSDNVSGALPGARGGVFFQSVYQGTTMSALGMTGNLIHAVLGRALTVADGTGGILVSGNFFASEGLPPPELVYGGAVHIFNAGKAVDLINDAGGQNGDILFSDNQVLLQPSQPSGIWTASVVILGFDDVQVTNNQFDCVLDFPGVASNVHIVGATVRCSGNGFKEGPGDAVNVSAIVTGTRMNVTVGNVATHCIFVLPGAPRGIKHDNLEWEGLNDGRCPGRSVLYANEVTPLITKLLGVNFGTNP